MATKKKAKSRKSASALIAKAKKDLEKKAAKSAALPKPERIKKATAEEARAMTAEVKAVFSKMGEIWWELGARVKECIDNYVPEALGKNATAWMKECFGDSWLKVYRANRAIAVVAGVPKEKYQKISEGNAYQLARLPEKVRKNEDWIDRAIKMDNEAFKEVVERQREKKGIKRDPMIMLSDVFGFRTIPKTLADTVKRAMDLAAKAEQFDMETKEGRINAFELIFAEFLTTQVTEEEAKAGG